MLPISLLVIPWLLILPFFGMLIFTHEFVMSLFQYIYNPVLVLFPAVLILNLGCALFGRLDSGTLILWNLRIKLWLIPVYLFILFFAIFIPIAIPFLFLFDALLLLVSSCYGLRALVRARKAEQIGKGKFLILFLCHFCFVADVVAAYVLQRKLK
jgi:hypothetical protein